MAKTEFQESGLRFLFDTERIAKPDALPQKGLQGVRGCDFIWRKSPDKVWLIEVKSSAPRSGPELGGYLDELRDKFIHSLLLWLARGAGRHAHIVMPGALTASEAYRATPQCVLVVSGLPDSSLFELQNALQRTLRPICRAFDMPPVLAIGAERAARHFTLGGA